MFYLYGFHPEIVQSYQRYLSRFSNHISICATPDHPMTKDDVLVVDADRIQLPLSQRPTDGGHVIVVGTRTPDPSADAAIRYFNKPVCLSAIGHAILEWSMPELDYLLDVADGWQLTMHRKMLIHSHTKRSIALTDKEGDLLSVLLQASPHTVSKDSLLQQIWGYGEQVDTHTLETHIYRLRTKLSDILTEGKGLLTHADGYGFLR